MNGPETLLPLVRSTVRGVLLASPAYKQLDDQKKKQMAAAMVRVSHAAATMIDEELQSAEELKTRTRLVKAQAAGGDFSGVSAQKIAGTTRDVLNAVSFPRFVTELINGVFKSMVDSSVQQMHSYVDLLNNVSASLDGFADLNMGQDRARAWLVERFPDSYEWSSPPGQKTEDDEDPPTLQTKDSGTAPSEQALRTALGIEPEESVPGGGDPESLLPFVRRALAKSRQQMLSTMVMLGMQRIVVESGKISASMHFHIDTHSGAQSDSGSTISEQNQIDASGSFGVGAWGASAKMSNTIGYVSTNRSQTTETLNTDLDLDSSVEINFKSDYLPLNRLASSAQADRIQKNSLNPAAEMAATTAREAADARDESARRKSTDEALKPATASRPPSATPATPKSVPPATTDKTATSDKPVGQDPVKTQDPAKTQSPSKTQDPSPADKMGSAQTPKNFGSPPADSLHGSPAA